MEIWKRGRGHQLTVNFHCREFECLCGICSDQRLDFKLVARLQAVRDDIGLPLKINAGFRCARKQQMLRDQGFETAAGISTHEMGQAADIAFVSESDKTPENMAALLAACEKAGFKAIGIAKRWLHVDERADKVRRWGYK